MTQTTIKDQVKATIEIIKAVSDTIRELCRWSSTRRSSTSWSSFKLVRRESTHMLVWIGPAKEGG